MMKQLAAVSIFILGMAFGTAAGYFAGQSLVYEKIMSNTEMLIAPHAMPVQNEEKKK